MGSWLVESASFLELAIGRFATRTRILLEKLWIEIEHYVALTEPVLANAELGYSFGPGTSLKAGLKTPGTRSESDI